MNILLWIVFGGIAGWVASLIVGGDMGILGNVVVGIAGAFIGGKLSSMWNPETVNDGSARRPTSIASFLWAVVGASILLLIVNLIW